MSDCILVPVNLSGISIGVRPAAAVQARLGTLLCWLALTSVAVAQMREWTFEKNGKVASPPSGKHFIKVGGGKCR